MTTTVQPPAAPSRLLRAKLLAPLTSVRHRTYFVYVREPGSARLVPDARLRAIVVGADTLQLGDELVHQPAIGRTSVTWHQHTGQSVSSGVLFFAAGGLLCHGTITSGPPDATVRSEVFASAVPPSTYATKVTKQRQPVGTDPGSLPPDAWRAGPSLQLGYQLDPSTGFPDPVVRLAGQDFSQLVGLNVNDTDQLELGIAADSESSVICAVDPTLPLTAEAVFALSGKTFSGTVQATCADPSGTGAYLLTGEATSSLAVPRPRLVARPMAALAAAATPSLGELLSLVPDSSVADQSNALMVQCMKWSLGQADPGKGWLHDFWLQGPPALPPDRIALVKRDLSWYQDQFAVSYLSYGLNDLTGPASPDTHLDAAQAAKLSAYLSSGMGTSESYARQSSGLFQQAYQDAKPRLAAYVADGARWAAELLDYAGAGTPLLQMCNRIVATNDASSAGNITALLTMLDPSGAAAAAYQQRLLANLLVKASLQTTVQDEAWTMGWLPDLLEAFADRYAPPTPANVRSAADAGSTETEAGGEAVDVAKALRQAAEGFGGFTELAKALLQCYMQYKGLPLAKQGEAAAEAFEKAYPKYGTAAKILFIVSWGVGLLSVITALINFSDLSGTQRAGAITKVISLVNDGVEFGLKLFKPAPTVSDWVALQEFTAQPSSLNTVSSIGTGLAGEEFEEIALTETTALFDKSTGAVNPEGTTWVKVFSGAEKVVAWIGVAIAAVSTVLSFIDFINDIRKGHVPQAVLDGILTAANAAMTVSLVVGIALESLAATFAASVFAVIGLVITIIEMFLPEPKEPTPAESFMTKVAIPFVDALPVQA